MNQLLEQGRGRSIQDQPHAIKVNVVVKSEYSDINFQVTIDPEIPFNCFKPGIKEQIFAQRMWAQYEENIEWKLGNELNLQENDNRTLQMLGFTNNCTLYVRLKRKDSSQNNVFQEITFNVVVNLQKKILNLEVTYPSNIPFDVLVNEFKNEIFASTMESKYEETMEWQLENGLNLKEYDCRTLQTLGFTNNCTLCVKLKMRSELEKQKELQMDKPQKQNSKVPPHAISVNVVVEFYQSSINVQVTIDSEIPFNQFIAGIKEQIFAQKKQAQQYEESSEYQLGNGPHLKYNNSQTLQMLGFTNNCTLFIRLKLKGGQYSKLDEKKGVLKKVNVKCQ